MDGDARPRLLERDDAALVRRDRQRAALEVDGDIAFGDEKLELGTLDVDLSAGGVDLVDLLGLHARHEPEDATVGFDLDSAGPTIRIVDEVIERRLRYRAQREVSIVEKHEQRLALLAGA
jgi:hypothetical protein